MATRSKLGKFINDNLVAITVIPLLVGIHWTWSRLQDVPELVPPEEKKEMPVIIGAKYLERKILGLPDSAEK